MFEGWGEFYLMAGSSAAVLIGLIFVVVTLMHDQPRSSVLDGARLYMGPVVLQVSFVLALSAAALAQGITPGAMALVAAVVAAWGLMRAVHQMWGEPGQRHRLIRNRFGDGKFIAEGVHLPGIAKARKKTVAFLRQRTTVGRQVDHRRIVWQHREHRSLGPA
jgi:hypothetical protein